MKKKILSVLIICIIFLTAFCSTSFCDTAVPTVSVGTAQGKPGELVKIPLVLANNSNFSNLGFEITFDISKLKLVNIESEKFGSNFTGPNIPKEPLKLHPLTALPMPCILKWNTSAGTNSDYNGILAYLTFEVISDDFNENIEIFVDYQKGQNGDFIDGLNVNFYTSGGGATGNPVQRHPIGFNYRSGAITILPEETDMTVTKNFTEDQLSYDLNIELSGKAYTGTLYVTSFFPSGKMKSLIVYPATKKTILKNISAEENYKVFWWDNSTLNKMVLD